MGPRQRGGGFDVDEEVHYPTRPVDKDKAEHELLLNIKKATSPEETAPKQKHVRSTIFMFRIFLVLNVGHKNVLSLHGIITRQYLSGVASGSNLFWRMKFKLSRL